MLSVVKGDSTLLLISMTRSHRVVDIDDNECSDEWGQIIIYPESHWL
jgi:hypothetical protein